MPWRWTQSLASSRRSRLPSSQVLCLRTRCCGVMNLRCLETAGLWYWAFEVYMESFMAISRAPVFRFARRFSRSPRLLVLTSLDKLASRLSVRSKLRCVGDIMRSGVYHSTSLFTFHCAAVRKQGAPDCACSTSMLAWLSERRKRSLRRMESAPQQKAAIPSGKSQVRCLIPCGWTQPL